MGNSSGRTGSLSATLGSDALPFAENRVGWDDAADSAGERSGDALLTQSPLDVLPQTTLAHTLVRFSDTLDDSYDVDSTLQHLVDICAQVVPGSEVSVIIDDGDKALRVAAGSNERKIVLEQYQIDHSEGPSLDAYANQAESTVVNLDDDGQSWPTFAKLAKIVGYRAIHSVPLCLRDETIGVLSVAETSLPTVRLPLQMSLLRALATGTAVGILNRRAYASSDELRRQLQGALTTRVLIEQSKGAVAARLGLTVDEAFEMLRAYARESNQKLNDVSGAIMDGSLATHELWKTRKPAGRGRQRVTQR
jgi:transcriptional regulator with GAF, ATPase, and Fis domain